MAVPSIGASGGATNLSPGTSPRTLTIDIGTPSNSKLFVGINSNDVDDSATAVTWNGVSMTRVTSRGSGSLDECDMWVLDSPASGSQTLSMSFSGDGTYGGQVWWVRVDDAGNLGTPYTNSGTSTTPASGSQTCPTNGMLLTFAVHSFSSSAPSITSGTSITIAHPNNRRPVAGYRTSTGDTAWSFASSQAWNLVGVPIEEIGGAATSMPPRRAFPRPILNF